MLRRESQGPSKTEGKDQALGEASRQPAAESRNEAGKIREGNREQSSRAAVQTGRPDTTPGSGPHGQEGIHPSGSASWWPGPRAGLTLAGLEAGAGPERSRLPWPLDALPVASTCPCADAADAAHPLPASPGHTEASQSQAGAGRGGPAHAHLLRRPGCKASFPAHGVSAFSPLRLGQDMLEPHSKARFAIWRHHKLKMPSSAFFVLTHPREKHGSPWQI